MDGRQKEEII